MKNKLLLLLVLVLSLALCAMFGGCTKADPGAETPAETEAPAEETPAADNSDLLSVVISSTIENLDPHQPAGIASEIAREQMYDCLVWLDEDNELVPRLATEWEVSDDGLTYTFHLREGVKWHDGSDFTSRDVEATFDRLLNDKYGANRKDNFTYLSGVNVVDEYTVQLIFSQPNGTVLNMLAMGAGVILNADSIEQYKEDLTVNANGTGPYKLVSFTPGESVLMERNDDYWDGDVYFKQLKITSVTEASTRAVMAETGEAQFVMDVSPSEVERLEAVDGLSVVEYPTNRVCHVAFNQNCEPLKDVRVRQAFEYAINTQELIDGVLSGLGTATDSIVATNTNGYASPGLYSYDPDKAKELLAEAGYADGLTLKFYVPQGRYFRDKETGLAVAQQMAAVGVTLETEVVEWATFLEKVKCEPTTCDSEVYLMGWEASARDAGIFVGHVFITAKQPPNGWNSMFYSNARVDELFALSAAESDAAKRQEYVTEAQQVIAEDAVWVPLYVYGQNVAIADGLEGVGWWPTQLPLFHDAHF